MADAVDGAIARALRTNATADLQVALRLMRADDVCNSRLVVDMASQLLERGAISGDESLLHACGEKAHVAVRKRGGARCAS